MEIEYAVLQRPWPRWMNVDMHSADMELLAVATRVISAHAGDGLDPESVSILLETIADSDAMIHMWLDTFNTYRKRIVACIGMDVIRGFALEPGPSPIDTAPPMDLITEGPQGIIAVSCTARQLSTIGLPSGYLLQFSDVDRIGVCPINTHDVDWTHYPDLDELIGNYRYIFLAGGEHYTDCLIASIVMDGFDIADMVRRAAVDLNWNARFLGSVAGDEYENLYRRTL